MVETSLGSSVFTLNFNKSDNVNNVVDTCEDCLGPGMGDQTQPNLDQTQPKSEIKGQI